MIAGFVTNINDEIIDTSIYPIWDIIHKFKNAEAHALKEGFDSMTIANAFNGMQQNSI